MKSVPEGLSGPELTHGQGARIVGSNPHSQSPCGEAALQAEGVGFEPTSALRRQQFSRLPRSTTPAPLRGLDKPNAIGGFLLGNGLGNETRTEIQTADDQNLRDAIRRRADQVLVVAKRLVADDGSWREGLSRSQRPGHPQR
jgi:hypothetical protein